MTQAGAQMRYSATELAIDDDILTGVLMDSALGFQTHKVTVWLFTRFFFLPIFSRPDLYSTLVLAPSLFSFPFVFLLILIVTCTRSMIWCRHT